MASTLRTVDYSLYLVTGRELLPEGQDYYKTIEEAIRGGVAIVQIREKNCDTAEFLEVALKTKEICRKYQVPIIINDRIDIALAINADGVHLGQTDMPLTIARRLLPPDFIVGVSCNTPLHAAKAVQEGANYIGIGSVWPTKTKQMTNPVVGVRGVGEILEKLEGSTVRAVAIGGINATNLVRTLHGAQSMSSRSCDGVAVVSDIMASPSPFSAAIRLSGITRAFLAKPKQYTFSSNDPSYTADVVLKKAAALLSTIKEKCPLIHQITNNVVINQSANATLALGASPIMATAAPEMRDLSQISDSLLVNFGTIGDKFGMLEAGTWANATRKPIVFDPVAVGATEHRRTIANELLNAWQATVIKGNAAEIGALAQSTEVQSRGVDSIGSGFSNPASIVANLALKERCIVVMSGETDWISDGRTVIKLSNGHSLLGMITGSGCMLGTCIATFCAAESLSAREAVGDTQLVKGDMFIAAVGGVLAMTIAAEYAAARPDVKGTGSFLPALLDGLCNLTEGNIIEKAKIQIVA